MASTQDTELTAAERIALARRLGAGFIAKGESDDNVAPEAAAEFLLRAAKSRNHALGLESLTAAEIAQRESERLSLIRTALAATRGE